MSKQTANNNNTLRIVKLFFNAKIYKKALTLMNTDGEAAVLKYLEQFHTFAFVKAQIDGETN